MAKSITLSLDGMGGDDAPDIVLDGIALALKRYPDVHYLLYGDEAVLGPLVAQAPKGLREAVSVCHAPDVVTNNDKPSIALRNGRNSSMALAIKAVKDGTADGVVSAGNTGALMAISKLTLRTLPGIDRPAIAVLMPTQRGESVVLDLGANTECAAHNLVQFALMGTLFARILLDLDNPTVGLLNIGEEEQKGRDEVKEAANILREGLVNFAGFVEGDDIGLGTVDVVVTDGFTGNVVLKLVEGMAKFFSAQFKQIMLKNTLTSLCALTMKGGMVELKNKLDSSHYGGAPLLGLRKPVIKAHGNADALAIKNAVRQAISCCEKDMVGQIEQSLAQMGAAEEE